MADAFSQTNANAIRFFGGDDVILDKRETLKPEVRNCREDSALVRNGVRQNAIEGANAIGRDEQQMFAEIENLAYFAARDFGDAREIESEEIHRHVE